MIYNPLGYSRILIKIIFFMMVFTMLVVSTMAQ